MRVWTALLTMGIVGALASNGAAQYTASITSEVAFINDVAVAGGLFDIGDSLEGEFTIQCSNTSGTWEYCNIAMQMEDWDYDVLQSETDYVRVEAGQTVTWTAERIGPNSATAENTEYYANAQVDFGGGPTISNGAVDFTIDY